MHRNRWRHCVLAICQRYVAWHCDDLKMGPEIGLCRCRVIRNSPMMTIADLESEARYNSVAWHGFLPEGVGDASQVPMWTLILHEALQLLAAGGSTYSTRSTGRLEMDKPVNSGTVDEVPNWRRKLSMNLDEIFARRGKSYRF
ncbi:hypothetical protein O9929_12360 [Vibrio lentus]|nr:hypothetical protein [Vibrio lentus]